MSYKDEYNRISATRQGPSRTIREKKEEPIAMEPELVKQMGTRVREERIKRHWTQKELAQRANAVWLEKFPDQPPIQEKWLWTFEHAKMSSTNLDWVAAIAKAFDMPLSTLLAPSPTEAMTPEEQRWRMVLRMHGIQTSTIEDVVHAVRLLEASDQEAAKTKPDAPKASS